MDKLKIIQIQGMPNDSCWQGCMLGLGNDGVTYYFDNNGWSDYAPNITDSKFYKDKLGKEQVK